VQLVDADPPLEKPRQNSESLVRDASRWTFALLGERGSPGNSTIARGDYSLKATPLKALAPTDGDVAAGVRSP
jgi:hypothetical protein